MECLGISEGESSGFVTTDVVQCASNQPERPERIFITPRFVTQTSLHPEDGGSMVLHYTASLPIRPQLESSSPRKPQVSPHKYELMKA
jgi:hypothetical protein